jgi:hypothetical protein
MGRKISICAIAPPALRKRRSRLRRIFDAVIEARQRDEEREIRRLVGWSDGSLSDEFERQITEHLMRNSSFRLRE